MSALIAVTMTALEGIAYAWGDPIEPDYTEGRAYLVHHGVTFTALLAGGTDPAVAAWAETLEVEP